MKEKTILAEGLAAYTIERRFAWERRRPDGAPAWDAVRTMWARVVLGEMDDLNGKRSSLLEVYNQRLKEAEGLFAAKPAPLKLQEATVNGLSEYVSVLSRIAGDSRRQIYAVRELMDDMASHIPWAENADKIGDGIDRANRELRHLTARQPIRFTRLLLGWETGPAESTFLPGCVTRADEILSSDFFDDMRWRYGNIDKWPALCTIYAGRGNAGEIADADEFDVGIMNEAGDDFLKEQGIVWLGGPYEVEITCGPEMVMQ